MRVVPFGTNALQSSKLLAPLLELVLGHLQAVDDCPGHVLDIPELKAELVRQLAKFIAKRDTADIGQGPAVAHHLTQG